MHDMSIGEIYDVSSLRLQETRFFFKRMEIQSKAYTATLYHIFGNILFFYKITLLSNKNYTLVIIDFETFWLNILDYLVAERLWKFQFETKSPYLSNKR